jgi:hypothetical protein
MSVLLLVAPATFSGELGQVLVIDAVRDRNHALVERVIPNLVAADEEDRGATRVEGVEDPIGLA